MIYSSPEFLAAFPVFWVIYWIVPGKTIRLITLLIASFLFYAYGERRGVLVLAAVIALTYGAGLAMDRWPRSRTSIAIAAIVLLIANLGLSKYATFLLGPLGSSAIIARLFTTTLGISFFTFEAIAYLMDLRRGQTIVERSVIRLALFISVFPHLIAGPIMRPNGFLPQVKEHLRLRWPLIASGLQLFTEGLIKKRLLADMVAPTVDAVFAAPGSAATADVWIAALAYTVQIYGDFAGYTDMGRGIARMLGLELPLNFSAPYAAESITDFWRRWHLSLSSWLRDYLYISLGGNRGSRGRTYANLIVTMLLGGLWHGAGLTFVAWGGYHGALLAIERATAWPQRVPRSLAGAVTLLLVVNGWVLFRAHDFGTFLQLMHAMYVPRGTVQPSSHSLFAVGAFALIVAAMVTERVRPGWTGRVRLPGFANGFGYGLAAAAAVTVVLVGSAPTPFIYFRF